MAIYPETLPHRKPAGISVEAANDNAPPRKADLPGSWLSCLVRISAQVPPRTTPAQIAFFLAAARDDLLGKPSTFVQLRDDFAPAVRRTLHSTYKVFMTEPRKRPDYVVTRPGLGWLSQEVDPCDGRRRYIRLTSAGKSALADAFNIEVRPSHGENPEALSNRLRVAIEAVYVL
ncbi:hypothetical protein NRB_26100 [Novosphingobium sp. 11B]